MVMQSENAGVKYDTILKTGKIFFKNIKKKQSLYEWNCIIFLIHVD